MSSHAYSPAPDLGCRLRRDPLFRLEYAENVLTHGTPQQLRFACAEIALAFADPAALAQDLDPLDARALLERFIADQRMQLDGMETIL